MYSLIYPANQTKQASDLYLLLFVMYLMDTSRLAGHSLAWNLDSVANLVCFGKSIKFN